MYLYSAFEDKNPVIICFTQVSIKTVHARTKMNKHKPVKQHIKQNTT